MLEVIERAVARNLLDYADAVRKSAPGIGAAAIPCAGGTAAFMGAGSPLTTVKGAGPDLSASDIDAAEDFFRRCGAESAVFELAPWTSVSTGERLTERGYAVIGSEDVVVRRAPFGARDPLHRVERLDPADWPALMLGMNEFPDSPAWRAIAVASALLPESACFGIRDNAGGWMACAQLLPAAGIALFANDATLPSARRRGAQTSTIHERLRIAAERGFPCIAAEVEPAGGSERNYLRCGFHVAYARTHYSRSLV